MTRSSTSTTSQNTQRVERPTRQQAEDAVRTLLAWAGDDTTREGLKDTPRRVVEAYEEYFRGYREDAIAVLRDPTFEDVGGYDELVMVRDVRVMSHCEHHIAPFIGVAHVAYIPNLHVAGLSKLVRVVDVFARRLQTQENLNAEIADAIQQALEPHGVAVMIEAEHQCISMRGVRQPGVSAVTTRYLGRFQSDAALQERFLTIVNAPRRSA